MLNVPIGSLHLSLLEAATRQIHAAIDALEAGDYDVALTLAGAAEGMIHRDGGYIFAALQNNPRALDRFPRKDWISLLNAERDWLKHGGHDVMEIDCYIAAFMIARAASKLEEWSPRMDDFKAWFLENLDTLAGNEEQG